MVVGEASVTGADSAVTGLGDAERGEGLRWLFARRQ